MTLNFQKFQLYFINVALILVYNMSIEKDIQIYSHFDILREKENEISELKKQIQTANTANDFQKQIQDKQHSELKEICKIYFKNLILILTNSKL